MKILLDENLPKRLKYDLKNHEVYTVFSMGWQGNSDKDLMKKISNFDFDVFLTFDKNIKYQHNIKSLRFLIIVINTKENDYSTIRKSVREIKKVLSTGKRYGLIELLKI